MREIFLKFLTLAVVKTDLISAIVTAPRSRRIIKPTARIRGIIRIKATSNRIMTEPVITIAVKRITLRRLSFI
jgi:hypothetical protein